jgi:hypothetical protein
MASWFFCTANRTATSIFVARNLLEVLYTTTFTKILVGKRFLMATYTHFRMIAYEVPTVLWHSETDYISGWDPGPLCSEVADIPVPSSIVTNVDARNRLLRLAKVVDAAYNYLANPEHSFEDARVRVLNVFMVPEFYFRPPTGQDTPRGTYDGRTQHQILNALADMFSAEKFRDWLFVCGTILWNDAEMNEGPNTFYNNTAVCVHGGRTEERGSNIWPIAKSQPSGIDGLLNPATREKWLADYAKIFSFSWNVQKLRCFTVADVALGLEICLDHGTGTLKTLRDIWSTHSQEVPPKVQLHLLTAGGMPTREENVAADVDGYFLRNDGMSLSPTPSQLARVESYNQNKATCAYIDFAKEQLVSQDASLAIPNGYEDCAFPQRLVFYPPKYLTY